ncbi:MAG TPA: tetratricopeptide repeat protein, partial [Candidatus Acidoferrales bacterium]|nr:tetratricopeptide repeat protein [Candidatus Acidoferrales bacterium]
MKAAKKKRRPARADSPPIGKPLSRGKRWVFRCVLLLLPFLLSAVAEVCLRLAGYGYNPDFFKRISIGGKEFFVQNEDFSFRFFPREMVRNPGPLRFPVHKAAGTFRIFILGESAAMGDPAESFAPDRYLEALLREKYPERKFEVINTAVTAIDSHVILPIARECAAHDGDLWIIYMSNNEMVGPFGAATVFGRQAPPLAYARFVTALQKLRLGQWFTALGRRFAGGKPAGNAWGGMEMFLSNQIPPGSPRRETVYENFQKNLDDIVRAGCRSGATVLLNSVAVNLRDCPPFASLTNRRLSGAEAAQFDQLYTNAIAAEKDREFANASDLYAQASRLDPQWADLQFHWGRCLLAQSNAAAAAEHLQLACDCDALPFRADSRINGAIRAEPRRIGSQRLIVCDAANVLAAGSPAGICGDETFFEHVHFDFDARYTLARAWAKQIEPLLPPTTNVWISQAECEQQLGLSPWNRAQVLHLMVERMQIPPLSSQPNNPERRDTLEARIRGELAHMDRAQAGRTRQNFEKLLAQRPDDFSLRENYAVFLELSGDIPAATAQWEQFRDLLPQDSLGYFEAGRLLNPQQHYAEAETLLRQSLAIRPSRTDGWIELGNALALQQKYAAALGAYVVAMKQDAHDPQILLRRGKVLSHLNRRAEAIASYRAALALNPQDGLIHHELALELVAAGQSDAAGSEFRQAAQLSQDNVAAHFDYGAWL